MDEITKHVIYGKRLSKYHYTFNNFCQKMWITIVVLQKPVFVIHKSTDKHLWLMIF